MRLSRLSACVHDTWRLINQIPSLGLTKKYGGKKDEQEKNGTRTEHPGCPVRNRTSGDERAGPGYTQEGDATGYHFEAAKLGAGIALGLCGVGTGLSQGPIGAAAVGMIAEDSSKFVTGLIFTALPETIVLFGFLALFLL